MTDRELLELAAKAAGINIFDWTPGGHPTTDVSCDGIWNPLTDDGDALRLAVQLNLDIRFDSHDAGIAVIVAGAWDDAPEGAHEIFERNGARAARRAITRAAAAIGKGMP